nr:uncharacterized protein LOC123769142 isoform X1 [Procambarus clarkii]
MASVYSSPYLNTFSPTSRMSNERLGCAATTMPSSSPDLLLNTMNTLDMFDTSWECCSGVDNILQVSTDSSPSLGPPSNIIEENFFVWDTEHVLQTTLFETDLETCIEGETGVFSLANSLHADEEISLANDVESNISNGSSSSLTSFSVAKLPDHFSANPEDLQTSDSPQSCMMFSSLDNSLVDSSLSCVLPDNLFSEELQNSEAQSTYLAQDSLRKLKFETEIKECTGKRANRLRKHKKSLRFPLTTSSQLLPNSNALPCTMPDPPNHRCASTYQKYKASAKENGISPRKKKVFNILDSSIKWSELSSSEQWAVGEGLGVVLSQSLDIREKLDLLNLLGSNSSDISLTSGDDLLSILDNEKLESIRCYLKGLQNSDSNSTRLFTSKSTKIPQKCKDNSSSRKNYHLLHNSNEHKIVGVGKLKGSRGSSQSITIKSIRNQQSTKLPRHDHLSMTHLSTPTQSSKKNLAQYDQQNKKGKKCLSRDLQLQRTRTRKEYRQLMKEKRSGLFEHEEVVWLSAATSQECAQQHDQNENDNEDIDILG